MVVEKKTLIEGNGVDYPKKGDNVALHYTGCLYDASKPESHHMGFKSVLHSCVAMLSTDLRLVNRFDSSRDRGTPLATPIGIGRLIRGMWTK